MSESAFEPSPEQREWLTSLTEEQRTRAVEALTLVRSSSERIGAGLDALADRMLANARGASAVDHVMAMALRAEATRAIGRGDLARSGELMESATRYSASGPVEFVIIPDGDDETDRR